MIDIDPTHQNDGVLLVIPCLNEEKHLEPIVRQILAPSVGLPLRIVIVDGGSTDTTPAIAKRLSGEFLNVSYLYNAKRIQSAAVNLAVRNYGGSAKYLIRIDAHCDYPGNYCETLIAECKQSGASSVVVSMNTLGHGGFQRAVAAAQNSRLGNGGSAHRSAGQDGKWVDHGHHALMLIEAFRTVGGYDETFTHNEDAELDYRLTKAGCKIWLTGKTIINYYPRSTPTSLFRQYMNYGKGRARTLRKHHIQPKLRQLLPAMTAPVVLLALFMPISCLLILPALGWAALCTIYGAALSYKQGDNTTFLAGPAAMIMHFSWSLGFWLGFRAPVRKPIYIARDFLGFEEIEIDICVCTFLRPHLAETLQSIAQLSLRPGITIRVIVADNDDTPSAQALTEEMAKHYALPITYIHAPARNISIARNACLNAATAPLVAFIDDDECVTGPWLSALIKEMKNSGADIVLGPVQALYEEPCPTWIRDADFHSVQPVWVNGEIITGYTCNVLMHMTSPAVAGKRFRDDLGKSGGEDTAFFSEIYESGGRISFTPDAIVTEIVPQNRMRFLWLLKRRFRSGQTHAYLILQKPGHELWLRASNIVRTTAKFVFCFALALLNTGKTVRQRYWLLRGAVHAGAIARLSGKKELIQYGHN